MPTRTRRANPLRVSEARNDGTLIRKTSLQDRTDNPLRSSKRLTKHFRTILRSYGHAGSAYRPRSLSRSRSDTRNDLLFTMSDITRLSHTHERRSHESILRFKTRIDVFWTSRLSVPTFAVLWRAAFASTGLPAEAPKERRLVEPDGIEPTTSCLQSRRSPS